MTREILCGPAGSGKTRSVLDEYVATIAEHGEDAALLVLPTRLACDRTRRRLATDERLRGLLDARILTFPDLAQRILDANHANVTQISELQQRLLMSQVAAELCAEGALRVLAPMCEFPGFIDVLRQDVEEIKRTALRPEEFARLIDRRGPAGARELEFARVYERYQQRLQALNLYDDAGRFWQALDELRGGRRRPFEGLRTILVDGFDDFTTTQLQVLNELADGGGVSRLVISLCLERDEQSRPELFTRPRRTLERITAVFGELPQRWLEPGGSDGPLAAMGARLFAAGEVAALIDGADRVAIIEAGGRRMEVREVLGRVKDLLMGGVTPDVIGIIARDLSGYARTLREVAREVGVPVRLRAAEPVSARPSVQAVLDVARVPAGSYLATDVMRLIKSTAFDRSVLGDDTLDPDEIERVCAAASIIGGRSEAGRSPVEHWRERLGRYARRLEQERQRQIKGRLRDDDEAGPGGHSGVDESEVELVERVQLALSRLFERFAPLHAEGTLREQVEALAAVMGSLGVTGAIEGGTDAVATAANLRAVSELLDALRDLASANEQLGIERRNSPVEFRDELQRVADATSFMPPGPEAGVLAIDADQAVGLGFEHVFVLGMTERQFPRAAREDAVFDDEQRERLAAAGIPLDRRGETGWADAFLFYTIAASTGERLTLSYPRADAEGHDVLASWYVDEVRRCFVDELEPLRFGLREAIPEFVQAAGRRELLERSLLEAFGCEPRDDERDLPAARAALVALASADGGLLSALRPLIELEDIREGRAALNEYDARLRDPDAIAAVRALYAPDAPLSASALGAYGRCPYGFFAERVLGLGVVEAPSEEANRGALGEIVHRCLRAFFLRWGRGGEIAPEDADEAGRVLETVMREVFGEQEAQGTFADEAVFRASRRRWARNLRLWLEWEIANLQADGHAVRSSEQRFGFGKATPVTIGDGDDRVLLRGYVDRIDDMQFADGTRAFAVYDYKTGSTPAKRQMRDGQDFQLPVYALAARQMLDDADAVCAHWGYYSLRRPIEMAATPPSKDPVPEIEELTAIACEWALAHAAAIRAGEFSPAPPGNCGACGFRLICRWDEYRFARKMGDEAHD